MNKPEFSVIIPLSNNADNILNALESVQSQNYPVAEIIVVNYGSTDDSLQRVADGNMDKVKIINQDNHGVSVARNTGVAHAKKDYIAFLDADDEWMPFFTEEMAMLISHFPEANFYGSRYQCVNSDGVSVGARIKLPFVNPYGMMIDNFFSVASRGDLPFMLSSSVIKKSLFNDVGGFPAGESAGEDHELFVKVALKGPIAYTPTVNMRYRGTSANRTLTRILPARECPFIARLKLRLSNCQLDKQLKQDIERYCAAQLCHLAKQNIHAGHYANALALLNDSRANSKPVHKLLFGTVALLGLLQQQMLSPGTWFRHSN